MVAETHSAQNNIRALSRDDVHFELSQLAVPIRNITTLAHAGTFTTLVPRKNETEILTRRLLCKFRPNALLVGPTGVGKTAFVESFAASCIQHPLSQKWQVIEINCGALIAGTAFRGDMEKRLIEVLCICERFPNIVLFVDEAHAMTMTGDVHGGGIDMLNLMKPYLSAGRIRCILATTDIEAGLLLQDSAFTRRFSKITIKPLSQEDQWQAVRNRCAYFCDLLHIQIDPSVLEQLETDILPNRNLDSTLDLVDELFAQAQLSNRKVISLYELSIINKEEANEDKYCNSPCD